MSAFTETPIADTCADQGPRRQPQKPCGQPQGPQGWLIDPVGGLRDPVGSPRDPIGGHIDPVGGIHPGFVFSHCCNINSGSMTKKI